MKISVIIPTFNRKELLLKTLAALQPLASRQSTTEVIVVDDASSDNTATAVASLVGSFPQLRLISRKENRGPASARNAGATVARGEILAFTDDDCIPGEAWLDAVGSSFDSSTIVAVEGPVDSGVPALHRHPLDHVIESRQSPGYVSCNLAIRRETFVLLDGFDERFAMAAHEDIDLCLRLRREGDIAWKEEMKVMHPPRRRSWRKEVAAAWKFGRIFISSEMLLFENNRESYSRVRFRRTSSSTIRHVALKAAVIYSRVPMAVVLRWPFGWLGLVLINVLRQASFAFHALFR